MTMKTFFAGLATVAFWAMGMVSAADQGTIGCAACHVSIESSKVIANFDLEDYAPTSGLELVRLIPTTDDVAGTPWINKKEDLPTGIDFATGQVIFPGEDYYEASVFGLVEDVPVDWNSQEVSIILMEIETEDFVATSVFFVEEF